MLIVTRNTMISPVGCGIECKKNRGELISRDNTSSSEEEQFRTATKSSTVNDQSLPPLMSTKETLLANTDTGKNAKFPNWKLKVNLFGFLEISNIIPKLTLLGKMRLFPMSIILGIIIS